MNQEIRDRLEKIGVPVSDGSGSDAVDYATKTLGIPLYEIVASIGEEHVFKAIDFCAQANRLYDCLEEQPEDEDDEGFDSYSNFFV